MPAVTGVESVELAPIGANGAMPTTGWVKIVDIEDGSVSFTVPPLEKIRVRVEDKGGVRFVLPGDTDGATFAVRSLEIAGEKLKLVWGGAWDAATKSYAHPALPEIIHLAVRFTSKAFQGEKFQLSIPVAAGSGGFANAIGRAGFLAFSYEGEATTPVDATGAAMSPWGFKFIAAGAQA